MTTRQEKLKLERMRIISEHNQWMCEQYALSKIRMDKLESQRIKQIAMEYNGIFEFSDLWLAMRGLDLE